MTSDKFQKMLFDTKSVGIPFFNKYHNVCPFCTWDKGEHTMFCPKLRAFFPLPNLRYLEVLKTIE